MMMAMVGQCLSLSAIAGSLPVLLGHTQAATASKHRQSGQRPVSKLAGQQQQQRRQQQRQQQQ